MAQSNNPHEVFLFYSEGEADGSEPGYQRGNRHALLIFLRQNTDTEPDFDKAQSMAEANGWVNVVIEEAGAIEPEIIEAEAMNSSVGSTEEAVQEAYLSALDKGYHIIRFSDPIEPD